MKDKTPNFESLPATRLGSCPYHPDVKEFVRVKGTNAYVCPIKDHGVDLASGPVDTIPWKTRRDI